VSELAAREKGGLELLADLERSGGISSIGLHLADPDFPYPQFEALCVLLGKMHEAVRFAIGDAIVLGEKLYGEESFQAFESLNLSEEARREYLRVSERVPRSRRRKDLSWSHHRAVAALEPAEQKDWLKRASDRHLSHHEMRAALRERGGAEPLPAPSLCQCCKRPL
jgi:hypothetical protein